MDEKDKTEETCNHKYDLVVEVGAAATLAAGLASLAGIDVDPETLADIAVNITPSGEDNAKNKSGLLRFINKDFIFKLSISAATALTILTIAHMTGITPAAVFRAMLKSNAIDTSPDTIRMMFNLTREKLTTQVCMLTDKFTGHKDTQSIQEPHPS